MSLITQASGHPFRFAFCLDVLDSTQYSNGVVVSGNVTSITVPFNLIPILSTTITLSTVVWVIVSV